MPFLSRCSLTCALTASPPDMRILQATSEFFPYSKTGGLADMVAGLSGALVGMGEFITVATPMYQGIRDNHPEIKPAADAFTVDLGDARAVGRWWRLENANGPEVLFLENDYFYNRPGLYMENGEGYLDNPDRYIFFSRAVADLAGEFDLLHLHDWQTALVPMLLKEQGGDGPRTVFTIHNLAYQGACEEEKFRLTGLAPDLFHQRGPEHFRTFNLLKAGLFYADAITTVSPQYANEIQTAEFGEGLDGELKRHNAKLTGILNGVDYCEWRTRENPHLAAEFDLRDLLGKELCKSALLTEFGLPNNGQPLFGVVSRLAEQKGIDHLLEALTEILPAQTIQIVILGDGGAALSEQILQLQSAYPEQVSAHIGYDQGISHRIEAGSDFFVMPSRFEPCGLNQLYSLRYGAIPVVHAVGGLCDTVIDIDEQDGTGITYTGHLPANLTQAIHRAIELFDDSFRMNNVIKAGMEADFSWAASAQKYQQIYQREG